MCYTLCMHLKSKLAFSLVELMLVVAIFGVLTAISYPSYRKYQARAWQAEAKTSLSDLYMAMQAFHADWTVYAGSFGPIGYEPEGEFRYNVGFASTFKNKFCGTAGDTIDDGMKLGCGPDPDRIYRGKDTLLQCDLKSAASDSDAPEGLEFVGSSDLGADTVLKGSGAGKVDTKIMAYSFEAGAVGDPLGLGAATAANRDVWQINQEKLLKHTPGSNVDL